MENSNRNHSSALERAHFYSALSCPSRNGRNKSSSATRRFFGSSLASVHFSSLALKNSCLCIFMLQLLCCTTTAQGNGCELPAEWQGEWFQSDRAHLGPVIISRYNFSSSGRCIEKGRNNRYLVREESYSNDEKYSCYKCMVINMKHLNVIQYKESYCDPQNQDLKSLCHGITGDAMLFSMFRLSASPISCPFRGPLTFTYSRNLQECAHPVSQVDSCADDSRLLLRFQACADVPGSESFERELVCLGSWKEGVNHYLVGKINHTHANSDNDRYRCFIYEHGLHPDIPDATMMYLAQSADATCQGLISAYEGGETMKLTRANQGSKKCKLPLWLTAYPHWHTLDYSQSYIVYHHNTSLRISNGTAAPSDPEVRGHTDLRLVCHAYYDDHRTRDHRRQHQTSRRDNGQQKAVSDWTGVESRGSASDWPTATESGTQWSAYGSIAVPGERDELGSPNTQVEEEPQLRAAEAVHHKKNGRRSKRSVTVIVHVTVGCRSGYWCMRIFRRADHVVQVETGELAYRAEEACTHHYWNPGSSGLTTLVARGDQSRSCGPLGRYVVSPDPTHVADPYSQDASRDCNANNMPEFSRLNVGCTAHDTLELETSCPLNDVTRYQCHGRWDSDGVTYVVASPSSRPSGAPRRVCFAYSVLDRDPSDGNTNARTPPRVTLTARHDTCSPSTRNAHITLNATLTGPCAEASSIASSGSKSGVHALAAVLYCLYLLAVFRQASTTWLCGADCGTTFSEDANANSAVLRGSGKFLKVSAEARACGKHNQSYLRSDLVGVQQRRCLTPAPDIGMPQRALLVS
ncbi:hypothetical protein FHG87_002685 [Trinorchestia longiramus]|nr:hypothetical protein FHG87_002685 [Trinorchestia longiramus]